MDFGQPPFSVVCLHSHLHTALSQYLIMSNPASSRRAPDLSPDSMLDTASQFLFDRPPDVSTVDLEIPPADKPADVNIGDIMLDIVDSMARGERPNLALFDVDPTSQQESEQILGHNNDQLECWLMFIHSQIVKDPFHVFNMFYIFVAHGLCIDFALSLRDAIFIPDQRDKMRIIAWGAAQDPVVTWDYML